MEATGGGFVFEVQMLSEAKLVHVLGDTLGDLRTRVKAEFDIPSFEQNIMYTHGDGTHVRLDGDDTVLLKEKDGLVQSKVLILSRQVDPRFKTEKETAFLEALVACRFSEAKDILESSGVTIDPNCVHRRRVQGAAAVSECPYVYSHPALTVAMMAGLEHAVRCLRCDPEKVQAYMSHEKEVGEVAKLLIEKGADVNAVGDETQDCESAGCVTVHGKSPLCAAIQRGSPPLVRMLLDAKADPGYTMRYDASAWGPDTRNPFGPGVLKPESWLGEISNGSVGSRPKNDPRNQFNGKILEMLRTASSA